MGIIRMKIGTGKREQLATNLDYSQAARQLFALRGNNDGYYYWIGTLRKC